MAEDKYNLKNPAVKRILQEVKEMQSNPSDDFMSLPLEENIFEWQFAIRGPRDTEFEGGIYHGRIQLPAEYPFKPPSFMLLTPNGRFETQTKICLSISNHHPEHWQPSWSVRTALVALIAFMPTSPNGALGSLDYKKEERHTLAVKSREASPKFGTPERQKLIDEASYIVIFSVFPMDSLVLHLPVFSSKFLLNIVSDNWLTVILQIHEYMLSKAPPVPQLSPSEAPEEQPSKEGDAQVSSQNGEAAPDADGLPAPPVRDSVVEERREQEVPADTNLGPARATASLGVPSNGSSNQVLQRRGTRVPKAADDRLFTWAAVGLTIAIMVLLLKKFMKSSGHGAVFMDGS
ncbi:Ubiquitin-fold modifier-conjugating enzyme [Parasponia andersonii]|uniref:Ubiquitin-fold modifier-conjugating enzyme n=1 Tax=Parasponia andersonii TaxID=3476 RepID=A0A2P5CV91_PARAD|nr:Ubiquitin-fold modifier-conjugating enzyme [Parasponia andersonii]